ncbi:MAG: molybdopterin-dependent oxidoreductase [Pseudorhodobacter sp.]|nr:molybdopterin-dependent oxidoreductase [Pseudorhodobacter sp.]
MIRFTLNGSAVTCDTAPTARLSETLRETLGLKGTKVGCDAGDCGACTVLVNGKSLCACLIPTAQVVGAHVETVESQTEVLTRLRASFTRHSAAQCGICTPGMLMAAVDLLSHTPHPTETQVETALGGVLCRCTGYRKIITAVMEANSAIIERVFSGAPVGQSLPRVDGKLKADGDSFGADYAPEGALIVKAIRSPHPHADFTLGDLTVYAQTRGIAAVFTAADIPGLNAFGVIPAFADQPAIAASPARFRGECVALVAFEPGHLADTSAFPITWTPLPALTHPAQSEALDAPLIHSNRANNQLIEGRVVKGDAAQAINASAHIATGSITTAFVEHAYIEPEAGSAWMEGDVLNIRACTQAPIMDRDDTAAVLNLPLDKVRIRISATGGGFGSKLDVSLQPLIGLVTLKTGRPSRMTYTRAESMASTTKRHPAEITGRIGCDATGRITGMEFTGRFDTGAYASWGPTVANRVPVHASGPYYTPNLTAKARAIHTNGPVSGAFRGFGVPQAAVWQETLYDELAQKAGLDRLEFRILNALRDGDASATGNILQATGILECLTALRPHWQRALHDASQTPNRGVGIASCWYGCGNTALPNPSTIRLGITHHGQVVLHQGATDIGQGSNTVITQIVAEALGITVQDVQLVGPDTFLTPDAGKTSASRQTFVTGRAAKAAAEALRAKLLRMGNQALSSLPADQYGYALSAQETYDPPTKPLDENGQGMPYAVYGYGAQMVELSVDPMLGTVKLHKITAAHDLGRVINPLLATGQIEGGIAQGLGMALMEEYIPGRTDNLHDYLIPTFGDVPPIESILIEVPDPHGPYGAKGLGEHVLIPTAPAILNAITHATGARITQLPALPHRVLDAIRKARA